MRRFLSGSSGAKGFMPAPEATDRPGWSRSATPSTMTFWISERAPYVIRLVVPNGGGQSSWDMID